MEIIKTIINALTVFDFVLILVLLGFVWRGFLCGVIHIIGSIFGTIIGIWLGGLHYEKLAGLASPVFFGNSNLAKVVCFLIIFFVASKIVSFIFYLLDRIFKFISLLPFLKSINRLLGAAAGFLEGMIVLSLIFYFYSKYPFFDFLNKLIVKSQIIPYFLQFAKILLPLLPEVIRKIETILKFKFNFSW